jgi:hypothetical protein
VRDQQDALLLGHFFVYERQCKTMGVIRMAEKSSIQRIKDLDAERESGVFGQ